jgi:hypothetical protein
MVFRVHIHSNDEPNVQDMDNDDNFEKQVDCKEEDTTRSNESGDIKKSSKKSHSDDEARTSKSLGHTTKKNQLKMDLIKYGLVNHEEWNFC